MKTTPVTIADLRRSVISVPPLARRIDLSLNHDANRALLAHLRAGGVSTFLYGGNANFYNIGLHEYSGVLDALLDWADDDDFIVPSAGPHYGTLMDQAPILRDRSFPTVMVLPASAASKPIGRDDRHPPFAERFARPIVLYIKSEHYLDRPMRPGWWTTASSPSLFAIVRRDPAEDAGSPRCSTWSTATLW